MDINYLFGKTVNCCGFLKQRRNNINVLKNYRDNYWYYSKKINDYEQRVSIDENSWLIIPKVSYEKKDFSGVVVGVKEIEWINKMGISIINPSFLNGNPQLYDFDSLLCKKIKNIKKIKVVVVYNSNGQKRLVPFSCIKGEIIFDNGSSCSSIDNIVKEVNKKILQPAEIIPKENGSFELKTNYLIFYGDEDYPVFKTRILNFDFLKHNVSGDTFDWPMFVDDAVFETGMDLMKNQLLKEYGFIPQAQYGSSNYEKLINYAKYPFGPIINNFEKIFRPFTDNNEYSYKSNLLSTLKNEPNCINIFLTFCGIEKHAFYNRLLIKGYNTFAEYYWIQICGFTQEKIINEIIDYDKHLIFAQEFFIFGTIGLKKDKSFQIFSKSEFDGNEQSIYFCSHTLINLFGEPKAFRMLKDIISFHDNRYSRYFFTGFDTLKIFLKLLKNKKISDSLFKKISNDGFGYYNYKIIQKIILEDNSNNKINYSESEYKLEWDFEEYKFRLPKDTKKLIEIGNEMNNCLSSYALSTILKETIIVYVLKGHEYEICIELKKENNGNFVIKQECCKNNKAPIGKDLEILIEWESRIVLPLNFANCITPLSEYI